MYIFIFILLLNFSNNHLHCLYFIYFMLMDVVYFFKLSGNNSLELRYSLRSLINIEHERVFLIWDKPSRCTNVVHVPFYDPPGKKYDNVRRKRKKLLALRSCSENFLLMNDDFYILNPIKIEANYISWTLRDHYAAVLQSWVSNDYSRALQVACEEFPDGDDFETHTPFFMNKSILRDSLERNPNITWAKRSMYANYGNLKWIPLPNTPNYRWLKNCADCKIFTEEQIYINEWQPFLSSADNLVNSRKFLSFMKWLFPNRSPYEKSPGAV